ncbi:MAG: MmgE/PrpD family protein [Alphaproteobacteria bacterium]|nr:MmgE/PrpD family protein [Alphaproteobacteria bacterium]
MNVSRDVSITRSLAREIVDTGFADIPAGAMAAVKRLVVDHIGITYMGAALTGKGILDYARDVGGKPEAVLIGTDLKVPADQAAGINGHLCRTTDFEETGPGTHVGPLCVHTALAAGQRAHASGREVLAAIALGYLLMGRFHFGRTGAGWPRTGDAQHRVVAAAITARVLGFDAVATAMAMSLAWELGGTMLKTTESSGATTYMAKRVTPFASLTPLAHARTGVQAAIMAGYGCDSLSDQIDTQRANYDLAQLLRQPAPWHWVDGEMELKPWVCSRHSQAGMQAVHDLRQQHRIDPKAITAMRLRLSNMYTRPWQWEPAPDTYWEAIYSSQWAAAMIVQGIPAGPQWVSAERLADPFSRKLAAAVEVIEDQESSKAYWELRWMDIRGQAEIDAGGRTYISPILTMRDAWGSPGKDMPDAVVAEKFFECTALSMPRPRAERLYSAANRLEKMADVNELAALM